MRTGVDHVFVFFSNAVEVVPWLDTFLLVASSNASPSDAGLTIEERDIVAEAYDQGIVKVMVATCSLAAGINLPARRVILHGARMGRDLVGPALL